MYGKTVTLNQFINSLEQPLRRVGCAGGDRTTGDMTPAEEITVSMALWAIHVMEKEDFSYAKILDRPERSIRVLESDGDEETDDEQELEGKGKGKGKGRLSPSLFSPSASTDLSTPPRKRKRRL